MLRNRLLWTAIGLMALAEAGWSAPELVVSPTSHDFGSVSVAGPAATYIVTLTNNGFGGGSVAVAGLTQTGSGCTSFYASGSFPVFLGSGQSTQVNTGFDPTARGSVSCTFTVQDDDSNPDSFTLSGTGTAALLVVTVPPPPDSLAFADQAWDGGVPETLLVHVQNTGHEPISSTNWFAALSQGLDFAVLAPSFPIGVGEETIVPVIFDPASSGAKTDTLTIALDNDLAGDPDGVVVLVGNGTETTNTGTRPPGFVLDVVGPNPITDGTSIHYSLPRAGRVRLAVYDVVGRPIRVLVDHEQGPGAHAVSWSPRAEEGIPSGLYWLRLSLDNREFEAKKLVHLR